MLRSSSSWSLSVEDLIIERERYVPAHDCDLRFSMVRAMEMVAASLWAVLLSRSPWFLAEFPAHCIKRASIMNPFENPCKYCARLTTNTCPECYAACCLVCGVNICPMCVRVKLVQIEQAIHNRLVPWQHVETTMSPVRQAIFSLSFNTIELSNDYCSTARSWLR